MTKRLRATTGGLGFGVAAITAAVVIVYALAWLQSDRFHIGRADFTATYVGATLLSQGHRADLYDETLQATTHLRLIAPDNEGNLPYVNPPVAAALAVPLTALDLDTAYFAFGAAQFACLLGALTLVVPWRSLRRGWGAGTTVIGLSFPATLALLLLGQWDGVAALGLAAAYWCWRRERFGMGGLLLALCVGVAKPHLALGLLGFMLGWRKPRALAGGLIGAALLAIASLILVGPAGISGFIYALVHDAGRWPLGSLLGFTGLLGSWLGDGPTVHILAAICSVSAVAFAVIFGDRVRRDRAALGSALAGATALSLLASPHLLAHDLVLLAPALGWCIAATVATSGRTPSRALLGLLAAGLALALLESLDLGNAASAPPGRLVPLGLIALASVAWRVTARTGPAAQEASP